MRTTNRKLSELSVGNNVIIPIPQYDRGPTDPRNILGVIEEVLHFEVLQPPLHLQLR
jgi:hypothetical protein